MYAIGQKVVYSSHGVCEICGKENQSIQGRLVNYWILEPVGKRNARFFVPADNTAVLSKIHPLLSRDELNALLVSDKVAPMDWVADENQRKNMYRTLINQGTREELISAIRMLHRHRRAQQDAGRRLHLCDENFLRDAQQLIAGEVSLVLGIPEEQVGTYLAEQLDK